MNLLFLSPFGAVLKHAIPEAVVAAHTRQKTDSVTMMGCDGIMKDHCIVDHTLPPNSNVKKSATCRRCIISQKLICKTFNFDRTTIEIWVDEAAQRRRKEKIYKQKSEALLNSQKFGVKIGHFALYEEILHFKADNVTDFLQRSENSKYYKSNIFSCSVVLEALKHYTSKNKTDGLVSYNGLYSINKSAAEFAKKLSINVFSLHAGNNFSNRLSKIILCYGDQVDHQKYVLSKWNDFRKRPISTAEINRVFDHMETVIYGRTFLSYGSKHKKNEQSIRKFFNISKNQKILLATLSSQDERVAAGRQGHPDKKSCKVFETQVSWVSWLLEFARKNPDFFIVVRPHPREFKNKRSNFVSKNLDAIANVFKNAPDNCALNHPNQKISIHSIMLETSALLNNFSTAGLEFALFGLPVIIHDNLAQSYPADWTLLANSKEEYEKRIFNSVKKPFDLMRTIMVLRWFNLDQNHSTYDLSSWDLDKLEPPIDKRRFENFAKLFYLVKLLFLRRKSLFAHYGSENTSDRMCKQLLNGLMSPLDTLDVFEQRCPESEYQHAKKRLEKIISSMDKHGVSRLARMLRESQ